MNTVITFVNTHGDHDSFIVGPGLQDIRLAVALLRKAGYTIHKIVRPELTDVTRVMTSEVSAMKLV